MAVPASPRAADSHRRPSGDLPPARSFTGPQVALLVSGVLVNIGSFSIYPYLAVLLRDRMGMEMGRVGVVLGLATLVQFASAPATAALAERVGLQRCLLGATVLYSLGGAAFLTGDSSPVLSVAGLLLISAGGSLYSPAYRGYLMNGVGPERRPALVSAGNAAGNFGIALGPVLGALLIRYPDAMFGLVTVIYVSLAIGHLFLPRERRGEDDRSVERSGGCSPDWRCSRSPPQPCPSTCTCSSISTYLATPRGGCHPAVRGSHDGLLPRLGLRAALLAERVGRMAYRTAMAVGFACLAAGMAAFAGGNGLTVVAGVAIISVGNAVLFLKNDLERWRGRGAPPPWSLASSDWPSGLAPSSVV